MTALFSVPLSIILVLLIFKGNIRCFFHRKLNVDELKNMIDNKEMFMNLKVLEKNIITSLHSDELKVPIVTPENVSYLGDMSNFKIIKINSEGGIRDIYIIPRPDATANDLIKYEHITKEQLIKSYTLEKSDLVKRKIIIIRTLKIIKLMLTPMIAYRKTQDLKESLTRINAIFHYNNDLFKNDISNTYNDEYFRGIINHINELKKMDPKSNAYSSTILNNAIFDVKRPSDLLFTTNDDISFMADLDKISNSYGISIFHLVGSHLIALGYFVVLKLALKKFQSYFVHGELRFFSWQKILQYNVSDRFRLLDAMCDADGVIYSDKKRRKIYLKKNKNSSSEECIILEFLVHHFNKYQMELITNIYQEDFKTQVLLEHTHMKDDFLKFMCNSIYYCNVYNSSPFIREGINLTPLSNRPFYFRRINPFNLYTNYFNFVMRYNHFTPKKILYMHFLNLIGILNNESKAYVTSLHLPGYYNAIQLAFDDTSSITDLFRNLIECIRGCISPRKKKRASKAKYQFVYEQLRMAKCDMCKGTFIYINKKHEENPSMLQKYYNYVANVVKIDNVSTLIRNVDIYEDYDNFLTNDINWYTFLLLFRLTSYKGIVSNNVAEAMYLSLKREDSFHRTVTTSYWFPSALKKAHTLYVRRNIPFSLVEKLENMLSSTSIEKKKKSIRFMVHVNSYLQLDFFSYLNEPPVGEMRPFALSIMIEHKFKEWYDHSQIGYFFLNYDNEFARNRMRDNIKSGNFVAPKYQKWNLVLKRYIMRAYESYFEQRNVKNLFKYHNFYNISKRILLMKDCYELYSKHYKDMIFLADIFNIRKYLSSTPPTKLLLDRTLYYMHSIAGNSLDFYRYGIIYGFTMNEKCFKEIVDELFGIFKANRNIFSDISFLQAVYFLLRKIENSFGVQRRNDEMSLSNIFFFNVSENYSKMSKEEREEEIHNSMSSKFFAKTVFTMFQMIFSMKLSNNASTLDKKYGSAKMIGISLHETAFFKAAYAYYGSILDNVKNSFLPPYAKKPIIQIKYGKTFIFANLFLLCSKMYTILKLNNLSILCENQAIASPNYYSSEKVIQYINRKYIGINLTFFVKRIQNVGTQPNEFEFIYDKLLWPDVGKPMGILTAYVTSNLFVSSGSVFPESFFGRIGNQIKQGLSLTRGLPEFLKKKPIVHSLIKKTFMEVINGLLCTIFLFNFMRMYAIYQTFVYIFVNNIRVLHRFYRVVEYYASNLVKVYFRRYTTDKLLKLVNEKLRSIERRGYMEESMNARVKYKIDRDTNMLSNFRGNTSMLSPQIIDNLLKNAYSFYVDDASFFDDLGEEEKFLNDKYYISTN
ncbi:cytoadherence-linked asexual protein (CLAG) [Plasmodium vivax Brazil I]|uniref:Cytoadherence-linked asexual protein (CLAG) n=1 Tax=Plasmodium vivax (strain Brazil I) TaxID=1033975 RepID=A0A0J9SVI9_PLAV1|nr:cytoadherence-linked asexual protein (CLAG) [Plasmodium vivax Brazil I]